MFKRDFTGIPHSSSSFFTIFLDSLRILLRNKRIFFSIFTFLSLPLSILLFSLSFASLPLKSHVHHLETVAFHAATVFESRHIWHESRKDALTLIHLKALFFTPSYILSLLSAISAVSSTTAVLKNQRPNFNSALAAVRLTWYRPLVTTLCMYAVFLLYLNLPRVLLFVIGGGHLVLKFWIWVVASGLEVYLMAITGMGLVVSIEEERYGWEAIRVGYGLMKGRRVCGWMLSGLMVLVSGWIGLRVERLLVIAIDGNDYPPNWWTAVKVVVGGWEILGNVCLYGVVVVWSYVIATVYYSDCSSKRHFDKLEEEVEEDGEELVLV